MSKPTQGRTMVPFPLYALLADADGGLALPHVDGPVVDPRSILSAMGMRASRIKLIAHRRNIHWMVEMDGRRTVLRRYAADRSQGDVSYEWRLLEHLERQGWPVPTPVASCVDETAAIWCVFRYMPGRAPAPRSLAGVRAEQRRRGQLLAQLHAAMADLVVIGQREGWRRADEGLFDRTGKPHADEVLAQYERQDPEAGRVLRVYADRMRTCLGALLPYAPPPVVIHGDLTPWNIWYARGTLSAVLDFDAAHLDLRVADFALSWRGRYDDVVRGYAEVTPLDPVEQELLVPIFWAWIIASAVAGIDVGAASTDWAVKLLLRTEHLRPA